MEVTGKTIQLGIIGKPVEHSFSPKMHNFISNMLGNDYIYSAFLVEPDDLGDAIRGMRALNIRGINVTAPHKIEVMKYLDEVSEQARLLGSVNTVVNRNGKLFGYNTDSEGFYMSLKKAGIEVEGSKILVIGCGGVVKPTVTRIIQAQPKSVTIVNRTKQKAEAMAESLKSLTGFSVKTEIEDFDFDIVINTTSAGMEPQEDALPTDAVEEIENLDFINGGTAAVDMIYNPAETKFLRLARERGAKTLNGLDMLIYQGILAYELFTDTKLPDDIADILRKEVFGR